MLWKKIHDGDKLILRGKCCGGGGGIPWKKYCIWGDGRNIPEGIGYARW